MGEAPSPPLTAKALLDRLRAHYAPKGATGFNGGVLVPEVGWNGNDRGRRCDAIYVGFTSTSGRAMIGHEIKVSRSDWLSELANPTKADAWERECAAWYVVAPGGIIKMDELPPGWGLLTPGTARTRLTVQRRAAIREDCAPSWDAVRSVMARMDTLRVTEASRAIREETERVRAEHQERMSAFIGRDEAQEILDKLASVLGMEVRNWGGRESITFEELGGAFVRWCRADRDLSRAVQQWDLDRISSSTQMMRDRLVAMEHSIQQMRRLAQTATPQTRADEPVGA